MPDAILVSLQVGRPQTVGTPDATDPMQRTFTTGFFKTPVDGPVRLGRTNLEGDGQADLKAHNGPDKAVLSYSAAHYPLWRDELANLELPFGGFGENFTIDGLDETTVCLGDVFDIGEARVQVSQPRQPCWKLARRWQRPDLTKRALATGRLGWYYRVLREGIVQSGRPMIFVERPLPEWSIARINELVHKQETDRAALAELADCPLLAESWRTMLADRFRAPSQ